MRELLLNGFDLQAVVGLPSGVFKPYSGVGTAALIFENGGPTQSVWFYNLTADGFSLDDKRTPIDANDIPDVHAKWPGREEGPNSYRVPIEKIRENDLSLAAGRYKPVKVETVKHNAPAEILAEIVAMEEQNRKRCKETTGGGAAMKATWPIMALGDACRINPKLDQGGSVPPDSLVSFVPMAAVDETAGASLGRNSASSSKLPGVIRLFRTAMCCLRRSHPVCRTARRPSLMICTTASALAQRNFMFCGLIASSCLNGCSRLSASPPFGWRQRPTLRARPDSNASRLNFSGASRFRSRRWRSGAASSASWTPPRAAPPASTGRPPNRRAGSGDLP